MAISETIIMYISSKIRLVVCSYTVQANIITMGENSRNSGMLRKTHGICLLQR